MKNSSISVQGPTSTEGDNSSLKQNGYFWAPRNNTLMCRVTSRSLGGVEEEMKQFTHAIQKSWFLKF